MCVLKSLSEETSFYKRRELYFQEQKMRENVKREREREMSCAANIRREANVIYISF